ncbi:hypothetical protein [Thermomonospora echinospora]|nr:hypothetical protein [Thermomonospora echinospora]
MGNRMLGGLDDLKATITARLQHQPDLLAGFLAHTGLPLHLA